MELSPTVKEIDAKIRVLCEIPAGYITKTEFAKRAGVSSQAVGLQKNNGRINPVNMAFVVINKRKILYLDWVKEGPSYILSRPQEKWPSWFIPPPGTSNNAVPLNDPGVDESGKGPARSQYQTGIIATLTDANIEEKILKIAKAKLELQRAQDEVIDVDAVSSLLSSVGQEVRQKLMSLVPRLSSLVAAEMDPHKVSEMLTVEFSSVLAVLSSLKYLSKEEEQESV